MGICPMHKNLLQRIDPNSLKKRRSDYDFEFDRPTKRRKIELSDQQWLSQFDEESEPVFPRHIECEHCQKNEEFDKECDGNRPCSNCCFFVEHEVLDLNQSKFLKMSEEDLQNEIDKNAAKICKDRRCTFTEFESDYSMQCWLKTNDYKMYQTMMQKKRNKEQQKNETIQNAVNERMEIKSIENEDELKLINFKYKESEFRSFVPIYARYSCTKCVRCGPIKALLVQKKQSMQNGKICHILSAIN